MRTFPSHLAGQPGEPPIFTIPDAALQGDPWLRKALELILMRRRLAADEAVALGLANRLVDSAGLLKAAIKLAKGIISGPARRHRRREA